MEFVLPTSNARRVFDSYQNGTNSHALLISGQAGVGKRSLAFMLAKAAFCEAEASLKPCGKCGSCARLDAGTHPDMHIVRAGENKSHSITVDQAREIVELISVRSFEGGIKTVIIEEADTMQSEAQNALLKSLEEPPGDTLFFLTARNKTDVLPTIRSRCNLLFLPPLSLNDCARVLVGNGIDARLSEEAAAFADGAVGQALRYVSSLEYARQVNAELDGANAIINVPQASKRIIEIAGKKDNAASGFSAFDLIEKRVRAKYAHDARLLVAAIDELEDARRRDARSLSKQFTVEDLMARLIDINEAHSFQGE